MKIRGLYTRIKEKVNKTIDNTSQKVDKLAESADKFISDGNNQMKTITIVVVVAGIALTLSNIVTIATNIHNSRSMKEPKVINNIYMYKKEKI